MAPPTIDADARPDRELRSTKDARAPQLNGALNAERPPRGGAIPRGNTSAIEPCDRCGRYRMRITIGKTALCVPCVQAELLKARAAGANAEGTASTHVQAVAQHHDASQPATQAARSSSEVQLTALDSALDATRHSPLARFVHSIVREPADALRLAASQLEESDDSRVRSFASTVIDLAGKLEQVSADLMREVADVR
jgi:hypothetical protein